MMPRGDSGARNGAVLVAVVLLLLATTALAHGLLVLSTLQYRAARGGAELLAAELAAAAGARRLLEREAPLDRLEAAPETVVDSVHGVLGTARYRAVLRRLDREIWWIEAGGARGPVEAAPRATALWGLDPAARAAAAPAVVVVGEGGARPGPGVVNGASFLQRPQTPVPGGCDRWLETLDSLAWRRILPVASEQPASRVAALGLLSLDSLLVRLTMRVAGRGAPAPREDAGVCAPGPWNWGDPARAGGPCESRLVRVAAAGDLEIEGGVGQGLLAVTGDLLARDLTFHGLVVVGGRLTLEGDSRVEGLVRAAGGVGAGPDVAISASGCWAAASLLDSALLRPIVIPGGRRLGPLR